MNDRELMQQALDALETVHRTDRVYGINMAIINLRQLIANKLALCKLNEAAENNGEQL